MTIFQAVLALVLLQRGGELILAHANTVRLLRLGAVEVDRAGYKWFVVLHAAWLIALALTVPVATPPHWPLLALFFLLQAGRVWVIASLGRRWTTRLIVLSRRSAGHQRPLSPVSSPKLPDRSWRVGDFTARL